MAEITVTEQHRQANDLAMRVNSLSLDPGWPTAIVREVVSNAYLAAVPRVAATALEAQKLPDHLRQLALRHHAAQLVADKGDWQPSADARPDEGSWRPSPIPHEDRLRLFREGLDAMQWEVTRSLGTNEHGVAHDPVVQSMALVPRNRRKPGNWCLEVDMQFGSGPAEEVGDPVIELEWDSPLHHLEKKGSDSLYHAPHNWPERWNLKVTEADNDFRTSVSVTKKMAYSSWVDGWFDRGGLFDHELFCLGPKERVGVRRLADQCNETGVMPEAGWPTQAQSIFVRFQDRSSTTQFVEGDGERPVWSAADLEI